MSGRLVYLVHTLLERARDDQDFIQVSPTELADYKFMLGPSSFRGPNGGPLLAGKELRVVVD